MTADEASEAEAVRSRLGERRIPGIIDIHTHFMPPQVMRKVWAYFDSAGPLLGRSWPITYRGTEADRLARLRSFGVRRFTSLCYPHKPGMARWLNESGTFFPEPGAGGYARVAVEDGVEVFKAHVQVGGYDPNDPLLDPVWELLAERDLPVVIHGGDGPTPGRHTGVRHMRRLLERQPDLTLVIAHMGLPEYGAFLDLCAEHPRVHLDTTMAFTAFTEEVDPFPRDRLGDLAALQDRILFGSDFPNIPYRYLDAVDAVLGLGLGADWERAVFHENAARLFDLGPDARRADEV